MAIIRIDIKESLKKWAFATTDLSEESLKNVIKQHKWLQSDYKFYLQPTVKQLGSFATQLHLPFGNLLLDEPPQDEDIRLAFRTQKNAPVKISLTVKDIIYEMKRKQAWFKEDSNMATKKITLIGSAIDSTNLQTLNLVNTLLKLNHFITPRELFNDLRNQLAHLGILTMQKGNAGLGTNRPLDIQEMRAFLLLDDFAPLIFINQKDSYTARIFSLIHEFIHLLRGTDELLGDYQHNVKEERQINQITAAFLLPKNEFKKNFATNNLNKVASYFNVSPDVATIRAKELKLIDTNSFTQFSDTKEFKKNPGGNPYNNALSMNDKRYMNALLSAQDLGTIQPTQVASLIGISYKMLDRTVQLFNEREDS